MCLSPVQIKYTPGDYHGSKDEPFTQMVACRTCQLCRSNRVNDLVGRSFAEQCTASASYAVTLTYRGDGPETALLRYRDIQLFLKRLRKDGYTVRYICAGEYGSKKGRAHWHIILFFYGRSPQVEIDARVDFKYWTHGLSYFQHVDYKGFKYVLKYALKDQTVPGAVNKISMSKKPPLGFSYFMEMAAEMVDRRLAIADPSYSFKHADKVRTYWLQGRMREMFFEQYVTLWRDLYNEEPPMTECVENYFDGIARKEMQDDAYQLERDAEIRRLEYEARVNARRRDEFNSIRATVDLLYLKTGFIELITIFSDGTCAFHFRNKERPCLIIGIEKSENVGGLLLQAGLKTFEILPLIQWVKKHSTQSSSTGLQK